MMVAAFLLSVVMTANCAPTQHYVYRHKKARVTRFFLTLLYLIYVLVIPVRIGTDLAIQCCHHHHHHHRHLMLV